MTRFAMGITLATLAAMMAVPAARAAKPPQTFVAVPLGTQALVALASVSRTGIGQEFGFGAAHQSVSMQVEYTGQPKEIEIAVEGHVGGHYWPKLCIWSLRIAGQGGIVYSSKPIPITGVRAEVLKFVGPGAVSAWVAVI